VSTPSFGQEPASFRQGGESGWNLKVAVLFGAVIALLAANIYLYVQVDRLRGDLGKFRESTLTEISNLREASSATTASNRKHLETMREELEAARRQAAMAVGQAKTEALKRAEQLTSALAAEQKRQEARMTSQISEVREATNDANTKLGEVKTDVTAVKSDVASTRAELDKTIADLKKVNGDMGVMSGLIATNGHELAALKQLGERNYFEFDLKKTKAPQKVGDVAVLLRKTEPKKNKFTLDVIADDKRIEKKDRSINEPVQFYVAKAKQPYELVVNEVRKDQIIGYLATPKVQQTR
jgi:chromosome segregation ATPase